ncbi:MAG: hypothetical protein OQK78_03415 [Gammaproteobacteria bacterium]|nr:hypothetical protein [Gammaproteobacteria bacterium]
MNETLEQILSQPDNQRKQIVFSIINELMSKNAPTELIEAISCLEDTEVAEKAYEVIYQCKN